MYTTFLAFIIFIDIIITEFHSTLPTDTNQQQEGKKFLIYAIYT